MTLALVIAFVYSWVLTLVIFAVIPIVMIAGIAEVKALTGHTQSNRKAIEIAGKVCTLYRRKSHDFSICMFLNAWSM